jgi:hypothetical protein
MKEFFIHFVTDQSVFEEIFEYSFQITKKYVKQTNLV